MRIYLDTSVINGLYSNDERIQSITKDFFRSAKFGHFTLYGSETVSLEIKNTPDIEKRKLLIDVILSHAKAMEYHQPTDKGFPLLLRKSIDEYSVEILPITKEIENLASCYIENKIIPAKYLPDALHIACCVIHNVPILVSWNFKHIVKHKTRAEVNIINQKHSLPQIDLCSPEEV